MPQEQSQPVASELEPKQIKPRKYTRRKVSRPAMVARIVQGKIEAGQKINMREILASQGYAVTMQNHPHEVTQRKDYIREMDDYTERLKKHRADVLTAMMKKDLDEEQYRTLTDSNTKLTHDVQLLTGGKTENVGFEKDKQTLQDIVAAIQNNALGTSEQAPAIPAPEFKVLEEKHE